MTLKTCNTISARPKIVPRDVLIRAYGTKGLIKPVGEATFAVVFRGRHLQIDFIIIDTGEATLLGLDACEKLGLIQIAEAVELTATSPLIDEYADVFSGLGEMPGEYLIAVDTSVRPVIQPPQKIPLHLKPKLRAELYRMEQMRIICERNEPTDWVSALLTVEKPNGQLRVCLEPRPLNKAIKHEHFQIPTFDDVIAELNGKRMFTIIDMRNGFWHIKLMPAQNCVRLIRLSDATRTCACLSASHPRQMCFSARTTSCLASFQKSTFRSTISSSPPPTTTNMTLR